jgi:hypothetical protein
MKTQHLRRFGWSVLAIALLRMASAQATVVYVEPNGYFYVDVQVDEADRFRTQIVGTDFPVNTTSTPPPTPGVNGDGYHDQGLYVGFWALNWIIEGFGNDVLVPDPDKPLIDGKELVPFVTLQHIVAPHGEDPGVLTGFIPNWITNGDPAPQGLPFEVYFIVRHEDHWNKNYLGFFPQADVWDFVSWRVEIKGRHVPTPEPGTLSLALLGSIGCLVAARKLRRRR